MRVHRLQIQAFGPFPGHEVVDVDALADGGLFLLHGPTGAGKTSVLDAICFALYGRVPGSRADSSRLRSDHADPGVAPTVVCEFSVGPRRFEVTRSPAWERPKRRGGGSTTEQARVLVRELSGGEWVPLSTRIDEAAHLLEDVLGMGADQFTKLVLLPQGEFAAFLRADAQVRRALLEKLFGTDRFTAVQDWLREQRAALRGQVVEAGHDGAVLLARAGQACAAAFGPGGGPGRDVDRGDEQSTAPEPGDLADRVGRLSAAAGQVLDDAVARRAAAESALAHARAAQVRGTETADRLREWLDRAADQRLLDARAAEHAGNRSRLADAERTRALAPLVPALQAARARHLRALADLDRAEAAYPDGARAVDDEIRRLADAHRGAVAELAPIEAELAAMPQLEQQAGALAAATVAAAEDLARATAAAQAADDEVARHTALAGEADIRAQGVDAAAAAVAAARDVARAVLDRDRASAEVAAAQRRLGQEETARNATWQAWLELRERRLAGIAAELAGTLISGDACRVCGSTEHPEPARPGPAPVSEADEQEAHARYTTAQELRDATLTALSTARSELAATQALAGEATPPSAALVLAAADERLQGAREAAATVSAARAALAGDQARADRRQRALATAQEQITAVQQSLTRAVERLEGLRRRADAARGEDPDLVTRRRRLGALATTAEAMLEARRSAAAAATTLAELEQTAREVAREAGFESLQAAAAATLDDDNRLALQAAVAAYDGHYAETSGRRAALAGPTVLAVLGSADGIDPQNLPAVDAALEAVSATVLDPGRRAGLAHDLEQAEVHDAEAADRVSICRNAVLQLTDLVERAREHEQRTAPLLARFRTLDELTRCVEGTGGDNARRMTLSAYVLAARLEQVAAAATVRLAQMSSGRYRLEHTDAVDRGRGRSGLALEVVDSWTGSRRDTASLSGGESFYTSLALALGLADVVSAEAGGVSIETLFVDEGFGTLDDDTLEEVMDVLDGLRSGGRSIGIVSHVADLRNRIPAQLEVLKTEDGSTVRLVQTGRPARAPRRDRCRHLRDQSAKASGGGQEQIRCRSP